MPSTPVVDQLLEVDAHCQRICDVLMMPTPEALDRSAQLMEQAGSEMAGLNQELQSSRGDAAALAAAWQVRRSFQRAVRLLENANRFHQNWASIRGAMTGGYTQDGRAADVRYSGRLCVEA